RLLPHLPRNQGGVSFIPAVGRLGGSGASRHRVEESLWMKRGPGKPERVHVWDGVEAAPREGAALGVTKQVPGRPCLLVLESCSAWFKSQRPPVHDPAEHARGTDRA